ncbi:MAG: replication initiator protein A [Clostridiales Family XIII bacterium]|nr:replication initiator protein A [Clostridiales Family XIII bacterium]
MSLSRRNAWVDKMDRVYIYFTLEDVMSYLHCHRDCIPHILQKECIEPP